jgi:hypothetical protein
MFELETLRLTQIIKSTSALVGFSPSCYKALIKSYALIFSFASFALSGVKLTIVKLFRY